MCSLIVDARCLLVDASCVLCFGDRCLLLLYVVRCWRRFGVLRCVLFDVRYLFVFAVCCSQIVVACCGLLSVGVRRCASLVSVACCLFFVDGSCFLR